MKAILKHRVAMPIQGVPYSQIEMAIEWEVNSEDINITLKDLEKLLISWTQEKLTEVGDKYKNTYEDLNSRLEKARQSFIEQSKLSGKSNG